MSQPLVIGAKGQLGTDLCAVLEARGERPTAVDMDEIDICRHSNVREMLARLRPSLVINVAAYHQVDTCETHAREAFATNEAAVHNLALVCRDLDATLVHFSTDFVFDGAPDQARPFSEEDPPSPQSVYARSKLAGERAVQEVGPKYFLIRTCGLYGVAAAAGRSTNFVETMLRLARAGRPIQVVDDQRMTPTATMDLAPKVLELVETGQHGLYHVTSSGDCTWYEFAAEIFRLAGPSPDFGPTTSEAFAAPAKRPAYSVLSNAKLQRIGLAPMRHWKEALAAYMNLRHGDIPH